MADETKKVNLESVRGAFDRVPPCFQAETAMRLQAAAIRALAEAFPIVEIECPANTEDVFALLEDTFAAVSPKLMRLIGSDHEQETRRFRFRLIFWRIFDPDESCEEVTLKKHDRLLNEHGMRRANRMKAICALALVISTPDAFGVSDPEDYGSICAFTAEEEELF